MGLFPLLIFPEHIPIGHCCKAFLGHLLRAETIDGQTLMRDDTQNIYNQAVEDYEDQTFWPEIAIGFLAPGSGSVLKLSETNVKHICKHIPEIFSRQANYLSDEALVNKLSRTSFFNPNWSSQQVVEATEQAYTSLRNRGLTGLQSFEVNGEVLKIFIKEDGTFDTAYGLHKLTLDYFRK